MISSIYLCKNSEKPQLETVVDQIENYAEKLNITICESAKNADAVVSIGGDGTFLYAGHLAISYDIPLLGINLGRFGFLPSFSADEIEKALSCLTKGEEYLSTKPLINVSCNGIDTVVINEAVVERVRADRAVRLNIGLTDVGVDLAKSSTFVCDGIIVATPIGSTAYASSAGGPTLMDDMDAMVMAFVALHHPRISPIVFDSSKQIVIEPQDESILACDGKCIMELEPNTKITITASDKKLVVCEDHADILRRVAT